MGREAMKESMSWHAWSMSDFALYTSLLARSMSRLAASNLVWPSSSCRCSLLTSFKCSS